MRTEVEYGDNIYAIGGNVLGTLKAAGTPKSEIDAVLTRISASPNYAAAVSVAAEYVPIIGWPRDDAEGAR